MRINGLLLLLFIVTNPFGGISQERPYIIHTVAFYNCENLFDTIDGPNFDEEYLPKKGWATRKYKQKLHNIGLVLPQIGTGEYQKDPPAIIGVCEIENRTVLEDLVKNYQMAGKEYGIIHFDSPDQRGIDVGLLYRKKHFNPTSFINVPLLIYRDVSKKAKTTSNDPKEVHARPKRVYTRDQLLVTGLLDGEEIHIIVNHWPSRSGGEKKSSPFREQAGMLNRKIMDSLLRINPGAKIITMGDFNDGPYNKSIKNAIGAKLGKDELQQGNIYNPFEQLQKNGGATLYHRDTGDIFDHIMVSEALTQNDYSSFRYWKAGIYNKSFLIQQSGRFKGYPLRNTPAEPGFSDHFPVYIYLIKLFQ